MGFSLAEVKKLLNLAADDQASCGEVAGMTDQNLIAIEQKIEQLTNLKQELQELSEICKTTCCARKASANDCIIIEVVRGKVELDYSTD